MERPTQEQLDALDAEERRALHATLARAKALAGHWRAYAEGYGVNEPRGQAFVDCAAELEAALREG